MKPTRHATQIMVGITALGLTPPAPAQSSAKSRLVILTPDLTAVRWGWRPSNEDDYGTIARLTERHGTLYVGTKQGMIIGLDLANGGPQWRTSVTGAVRSLGFDQDLMYVGTVPGSIYAIRHPGRIARASPTPKGARP